MKRLILSLLCITVGSIYGVIRTTVVAARVGYPDTIIALRNQAQNFLRDQRIRMQLDVQQMRKNDLNLRADELTDKYKDAYFTLEEDIDETFEQLSREFIAGANDLDRDEASIAQKEDFINKSKEKAQQTVNKILKENKLIMRNNPLNVDI